MNPSVPPDAAVSRIVIAGVPRSGKTTLARSFAEDYPDWTLYPLDELIKWLAWSDLSAFVADQINWISPPWVMEGTATVRALRKWLKANPGGKPCDRILWLGEYLTDVTSRQRGMGKACRTIFDEITPELEGRGVEICTLSARDVTAA